jgi:sulfur carrier protein
MTIELNGARVELRDGASLAEAVAAAGIEPAATRGVAAAVDGEVVPRAEWEATELATGAEVEVVRAVQGG